MHTATTISEDVLQQLRQFDTCTVSNAIEQFHIRTRNEGFVDGSVHCLFPDQAPKIGYAVTARVRTSSTPISGHYYYDRMDWWSYVQTIPAPRFIVAEDVDHVPGVGALLGRVHASICVALGCTAFLTNGAVRNLPGVRETGLQSFARSVAVSHSYAHIIDFGEPVEVGGLQVKPGNLLHGDQHGVVYVPLDIAPDIPKVATELLQSEKELIDFCRSGQFSFAELPERIQRLSQKVSRPDKDSNL